jgi:hypothetical protein
MCPTEFSLLVNDLQILFDSKDTYKFVRLQIIETLAHYGIHPDIEDHDPRAYRLTDTYNS